jgi:hypothetical protein
MGWDTCHYARKATTCEFCITLLIAFVFTIAGRASASAESGSKALPTLVEVVFSEFSQESLRGGAITTKNASRS